MSRAALLVAAVVFGAACDDFAAAALKAKCDRGLLNCDGGMGGGAGGGTGGGTGGAGGGAGGGGDTDAGLDGGEQVVDAGELGNGPFVPASFVLQTRTASPTGTVGVQVVGRDSGVAWVWRGHLPGTSGLTLLQVNGALSDELSLNVAPSALSALGSELAAGGTGPSSNLALFSGAIQVNETAYGDQTDEVLATALVSLVTEGASPTVLALRRLTSGRPVVGRLGPSLSSPAWEVSPCAADAGFVAVHDSVVLANDDWLLALEHCTADDARTTLVRVSQDGGVSALDMMNFGGVFGAASGAVWVASAQDNGTLLEHCLGEDCSNRQQLVFVGGLGPADVVPGPNSLFVVGSSGPSNVTVDGGVLVPAGRDRTVVLEFTPSGGLLRYGWLDTDYSAPARGGSAWAHGRLWVTGQCTNTDGGPCAGLRSSAYLFSIGP